jgi:hypothetical protein
LDGEITFLGAKFGADIEGGIKFVWRKSNKKE